MPQKPPRTLDTLFVRSAAQRALPSEFRLGVRREGERELPVQLLRLAGAVKYCSRHRVAVHDARLPEDSSERSIRTAAAVHRPDLAVVWMHPALLADGLEAARAVRQAGCPLVLATGPLVESWPEGARRIPEVDGLLPTGAQAALLAALEAISTGQDSRAFGVALQLSPEEDAGVTGTIDRKLLDYAAYSQPSEFWPPPQLPPPSRVLRIGNESDKGRYAASSVPLRHSSGGTLGAEEVLSDMAACDLLGIPWQELRASRSPISDRAWWEELFSALRMERDRQTAARRLLNLQLPPGLVRSLPLVDLRSLSSLMVNLGDVVAGDPEAVDEAIAAARACRRAGLATTMTLLLGEPGFSLSHEETGLRKVERAGLDLDAQLRVDIGAVDESAWSSWLEAPGPVFVPPGLDPDRHSLTLRFRRTQRAKRQERPSQTISRQLKRLFDRR
ncbi:MAG: hypothetical protein VX498_01475 [Myxococcota bacterium]|nr:hypothetical protein [Myxococcota bacterium]